MKRSNNPESALWRCCVAGDLPGARVALARGADPNATLVDFSLSWATAVLSRSRGPAPLDGANPLILSALLGRARIFEALWEAGADPLAKNALGMDPLMAAMKSQQIRMATMAMDLFEARGLALAGGALGQAALWGQGAVIERLLSLGADPNEAIQGETPMTLAARRGSIDSMRRLARAGGLIESRRASDGAAALSIAAARGDVACMRAAIELGAHLDAVDAKGRSALHCCVLNECPDAAELLARHGAQLEERWPAGGLTPLGRAARAERAPTMKALIDHGANPHHVGSVYDRHDLTALLATLESHDGRDQRHRDPLECMRIAIAAGVDLEAEDSMGHWALRNAFYSLYTLDRSQERAEFLFLAGADLEHRDAKGWTLLDAEVLRCLTPGYGVSGDRARALLDRGARVTDAIKDALANQAQWEPTYQVGWSLDWVESVKAAALRQEEQVELARITMSDALVRGKPKRM